jgi:hypothetical protein
MRLLPLSFALLLLPALLASPVLASEAAETPTTRAGEILEEADLSLQLARRGEYGSIKRRDLRELEAAHATMHRLLEGHDAPEDLENEDRIELFNAQHKITAIVGSDDKNRKICKRVAVTGSRVAAVECLTVAERESRARAASRMAGEVQRNICIPGQDGVSRCGR